YAVLSPGEWRQGEDDWWSLESAGSFTTSPTFFTPCDLETGVFWLPGVCLLCDAGFIASQ
ncbi:MAG: hypothetical protein AB7F76_18985, partial [Parvibaculaceae bacterium]